MPTSPFSQAVDRMVGYHHIEIRRSLQQQAARDDDDFLASSLQRQIGISEQLREQEGCVLHHLYLISQTASRKTLYYEKSQIDAFYVMVVAARGIDVLGPRNGSCTRVVREHGARGHLCDNLLASLHVERRGSRVRGSETSRSVRSMHPRSI